MVILKKLYHIPGGEASKLEFIEQFLSMFVGATIGRPQTYPISKKRRETGKLFFFPGAGCPVAVLGIERAVTGLDCLGFASYGVAGGLPGKQQSTGLLQLMGSSPPFLIGNNV